MSKSIGAIPHKDVVKGKFVAITTALLVVGGISCIVNVLMLTGPMFMLQVYDRVLTSQSVPTLVVLAGLVAALYAMMALFDFLRMRILSRVAHWLDASLAPLAFRSWMVRSIGRDAPGYKPLQDLANLRSFISSPTAMAIFDLPWFPFYIAIVFFLHVQLGLLALAGAVVVTLLALFNELSTGKSIAVAGQTETLESRFVDQAHKAADGIVAMGMLGNASRAWNQIRDNSLFHMQRGSERAEYFSATSKAFRMLVQSAILGLGAYLAIKQEITPGMIIAASIIAGRALAPIDQTIGGWKVIKRANLARRRLHDYLKRDTDASVAAVRLPAPKGHLTVANVFKFKPRGDVGDNLPILSAVTFSLQPGEGLGVIGPSASGKSTLARLLVGLWMPDRGEIRLDGATFEQWDPDELGPHIGYLPQDVTLLSGSIAQNIARFDPAATDDEIIEASKLAGVHDLILKLPDGYGTSVDDADTPLTGGQRQRIALARAVFRCPRLVVLDEPNSNLDAEGDRALTGAIEALRERGSVVVVMAHRPSAIAAVDKIMMLNDGHVVEFGDKADVLRKVTRAA